jgi:acyl carrier protein
MKKFYETTWDNLFVFMSIAMAIEEYHKITITDEEWISISDIDDIIELINSKTKNKK